jgi:cobalt-zinc-cadmium efflux system protein
VGLTAPTRTVVLAASITLLAAGAELLGSWFGRSLFLVADAVHLLAHMGVYAALLIPSTAWNNRGEQLRTRLVLLVVMAIASGIIAAALRDLLTAPPAADPKAMALSLLGLCANVWTAWILRAPAQSQISFRAALVHELSDGAMTLVGLFGAVLIRFTGWRWVDPALAVGIGLWLLTWVGRMMAKRPRP